MELTLSEKIKRLFYQSWRITADYFKSRALVSLIIAVTAGLCFRLLKMPVWWLLALIAGLFNMLPIFGPWISSAAVGIVLLIFASPAKALYGLFILLAMQLLDEFLLTPLLTGKAVELPPLLVFGVTMAAGGLLGFWGILFSVPIVACANAAWRLFFDKSYLSEQRETSEKSRTRG